MFRKKIIGITNVDRLSQAFSLFEKFPVQIDTLLKTLNSEIATLFKTQDLENHTLLGVTYPYRLNKGVHPPGVLLTLVYSCIRSPPKG